MTEARTVRANRGLSRARRRALCLAALAGCPISWLAGSGLASAGDPASVRPESNDVWDSGPGFSFAHKAEKTRRSLSGIACLVNEAKERICLVAFDEGSEARYVFLKDGGY